MPFSEESGCRCLAMEYPSAVLSPVSELRVDERLYAVLAEVDGQLQHQGEYTQFYEPWSMDEAVLQPAVIVAADAVKLQADEDDDEPQRVFHEEGIGIGKACRLEDVCHQGRGCRHVG